MKKDKLKLNEVLIEKRYFISVVMILLFSIIGFFTNSIDLKSWIATTDKVFCPWWNIKFFALFLASYELFYIITNERKNFSFIGAILISFSGFVQYNFLYIDSLIWGEIITVLIFKILTKDDLKINLLFSLLIVLCSIAYANSFMQISIPFGFIFLSIIIFELIHYRSHLKKNKIIVLAFTLILSIVFIVITKLLFKINQNIELVNGKLGIYGLFSYLYNFLLPFNNFKNVELFGSFISIFPIPLFVGLFYLYKYNKHIDFLLPIILVTTIETIFCMTGLPKIIEKILFLDEINDFFVIPAVNLANVFMLLYIMSNVEEKMFEVKHAIRITIVTICFLAFIKYPSVFMESKLYLYLFVFELTVLTYMFLNYYDKKYQKVLLFFMVLLTLISGVPVNLI